MITIAVLKESCIFWQLHREELGRAYTEGEVLDKLADLESEGWDCDICHYEQHGARIYYGVAYLNDLTVMVWDGMHPPCE